MSKPNKRRAAAAPAAAPKAMPNIVGTTDGVTSWLTNVQMHTWLIALLSVVIYINSFGLLYTQDDAIVLTDNMFTTQGIKGIPGLLSYDTFYGFFKESGKAQLVSGGRYRPLTPILFALEYEIFGKNPFFSHLFNVLLYALTCGVLYRLLIRIFQERFGLLHACAVALITSLLFAAHPIHTEAVTNIKGRDEIVTLLLSLLAVHTSLNARQGDGTKWSIITGILFFLALMSKENAITFLAIVPMIYWFFLKDSGRAAFMRVIPFAIASVVFIAIRTKVIGAQFTGAPIELMNNPFVKMVGGQWVAFSPAERLATIMFTLGKYVMLLLFPHPLSHDYYPRAVGIMQWSDPKVLASLLLYVAGGVYVFKNWHKRSIEVFGIAFYLITLSIVSNIVFPVGTNMGERFVFMPSIGFCLLVAALLVSRLPTVSADKFISAARIVLVGVAIVTGLYGIKTFTRNWAWQDNYTLFLTDIKASPNSAKLLNSCGSILSDSSRTQKDTAVQRQMVMQSFEYLKKAIEIHPTFDNAYMYMGNDYMYLNQPEEALKWYQQASKINPSSKPIKTNLTNAYRETGKYYGERMGNVDRALEFLNQAIAINPEDIETIRILGVANAVKGNTDLAVTYLNKYLSASPTDTTTLKNLALVYIKSGQTAKAAEVEQRINQVKLGGK